MKTAQSQLSFQHIKLVFLPVFLFLIIGGCEYIKPNKPPYVKSNYPPDNTIYSIGEVVHFSVEAYDKDGKVAQVIFTPPGASGYSDTEPPYEFAWQTNGLAPGDYPVEIKAIDNKDEPYIITVPIRLLGELIAYAGRDTLFTDSRTSFVLEADTPFSSEGTWTVLTGTAGQISDIHNAHAVFTGLPCQTYTLRWTVNDGTNQVSDEVSIGFSYQPSKADAGADQLISDNRTTTLLQAKIPSDGTGQWRIGSGGEGSFTDATLPNTTFTGQPCANYQLIWSVSTACAVSADTVEIRFDQFLIEPDAGPDQKYEDGRTTTTMVANHPISGSGKWTIISGLSGQLSSLTDPGAVFTGQVCQTYVLRWTITTPCSSKYDDVIIFFNHVPSKANAGPDQSYSDGRSSVFLNASVPTSGSGLWKIVSGGQGSFNNPSKPDATFTGIACNNYKLVWTVSTQCAESADTVAINFSQETITANAGPDQIFTDGRISTTLAANAPVVGTGTWTVISGANGVFANINDPKTVFSGKVCQSYVLRWTIATACGPRYDEVLIAFNHIPTVANAGPDQSAAGTVRSVILAANVPLQGSGTWTVVAGTGGVFDDVHNPLSRFTGMACQTYTLKWTISTLCNSSSDQVVISFSEQPSESYAGGDQHLTDGSILTRLSATTPASGTGLWTLISGGTGSFSDTGDPHATFTGILCHSYILRWTVSTSCSSSFDEVNIVFNLVSVSADAGPDKRVSDGSVTTVLQGNTPGAGMTGTWTILSGLSGSLSDANSPRAVLTGLAGQIYTLKWSLSSTCIENSDQVSIAFVPGLTMFDPRDEKSYQAIKLGNQTWMAENLNYSAQGSHSYQDLAGTASVYGRLYDFAGATTACPSGWHLPSDLEWRQLEVFLGMDGTTSLEQWYRGLNEGGMLKETGTVYWEAPNAGATNITGFNARPGGYRTPGGVYGGVNTHAGFWTATGNTGGLAMYRTLHKDKAQIGRDWYEKGYGFSVRCIKN